MTTLAARDAALEAEPERAARRSTHGVLTFANLAARALLQSARGHRPAFSDLASRAGRSTSSRSSSRPSRPSARSRRRGRVRARRRGARLDVTSRRCSGADDAARGEHRRSTDVTRSSRSRASWRATATSRLAYEELQSTNEELETTNEELQSTNEELETTNEELQSTNEELETMNEELQSTNEELETINEELRDRTGELNR